MTQCRYLSHPSTLHMPNIIPFNTLTHTHARAHTYDSPHPHLTQHHTFNTHTHNHTVTHLVSLSPHVSHSMQVTHVDIVARNRSHSLHFAAPFVRRTRHRHTIHPCTVDRSHAMLTEQSASRMQLLIDAPPGVAHATDRRTTTWHGRTGKCDVALRKHIDCAHI